MAKHKKNYNKLNSFIFNTGTCIRNTKIFVDICSSLTNHTRKIVDLKFVQSC